MLRASEHGKLRLPDTCAVAACHMPLRLCFVPLSKLLELAAGRSSCCLSLYALCACRGAVVWAPQLAIGGGHIVGVTASKRRWRANFAEERARWALLWLAKRNEVIAKVAIARPPSTSK